MTHSYLRKYIFIFVSMNILRDFNLFILITDRNELLNLESISYLAKLKCSSCTENQSNLRNKTCISFCYKVFFCERGFFFYFVLNFIVKMNS